MGMCKKLGWREVEDEEAATLKQVRRVACVVRHGSVANETARDEAVNESCGRVIRGWPVHGVPLDERDERRVMQFDRL